MLIVPYIVQQLYSLRVLDQCRGRLHAASGNLNARLDVLDPEGSVPPFPLPPPLSSPTTPTTLTSGSHTQGLYSFP